LSDSDRDTLLRHGVELSDDNKKRALYAEFVTYTVMTAPSEKIFALYSLGTSKGEPLRPSSVVRKIRKLFPDTVVKQGTETMSGRVGKSSKSGYFDTDTSIAPETAEALLRFESDRAVMSVSKLDKFQSCPYSFLLSYGLRLNPRKEFKIEATDAGTFCHGLIEYALREITESPDAAHDISYEECFDAVESAFENVTSDSGFDEDIFLGSERNKFITSCMKKIAVYELKNLAGQIRHNHLKPIGFETQYGSDDDADFPPVTVECEDGFKVLLNGKIDRIDAGLLRSDDLKPDEETPVYFRVIDYKSYDKDAAVSDIVNGNELQLIVYVMAAKEGLKRFDEYKDRKIIPAAAFYYTYGSAHIELEKSCDGDIDDNSNDRSMKGLFLAKENSFEALHGGVYDKAPKASTFKNASAVPENGFDVLEDSAKENIRAVVSLMRSGEFEAKPFKKSLNDMRCVCDKCNFKSVCRVDSSNPENIRLPKSFSKDDYWTKHLKNDE